LRYAAAAAATKKWKNFQKPTITLFLIMMQNYPKHGNASSGIRLPAVVSALY
jgi:hypothetical protein